MRSHIFESESGLSLKAFYEVDPNGVVNFSEIYVLGKDYRVSGPDIAALLDGLYYIRNGTAAESLLGMIAKEIDN